LLDKKIFKYILVGALGTISNLLMFYIFISLINISYLFISFFCFLISNFQNYVINHYWTFKNKIKNKNISVGSYLQYLFVNLFGLLASLLILYTLVDIFYFNYKVLAQGIGVLGGLVINYIGSKNWVFKKN